MSCRGSRLNQIWVSVRCMAGHAPATAIGPSSPRRGWVCLKCMRNRHEVEHHSLFARQSIGAAKFLVWMQVFGGSFLCRTPSHAHARPCLTTGGPSDHRVSDFVVHLGGGGCQLHYSHSRGTDIGGCGCLGAGCCTTMHQVTQRPATAHHSTSHRTPPHPRYHTVSHHTPHHTTPHHTTPHQRGGGNLIATGAQHTTHSARLCTQPSSFAFFRVQDIPAVAIW